MIVIYRQEYGEFEYGEFFDIHRKGYQDMDIDIQEILYNMSLEIGLFIEMLLILIYYQE